MNHPSDNPESATVVFVHGLWVNGMELMLLRQMVRSEGFATEQFSYRTVAGDLDENAAALRDFLAGLDVAGPVHLVGHSLGGLLILHAFQRFGAICGGRVVFMGSPVRGSQAARALAGNRLGQVVLGEAREGLVPEGAPVWHWSNELGVIAGSASMGLGMAITGLPRPNDGTVAVEETEIDGASDRVIIRVTHTGMAISRRVARQIGRFLSTGTFSRDPADTESTAGGEDLSGGPAED